MKLNIGIMGAGGIAVKFVQAASMVSDVEVCAVASKSLGRARSFAEANHIPHAFGDYQAMLSSGLINAVYVATTGNFHYENILLALNSGMHVLCEKNMVATTKEAERIFALAKEKRLFVMEAMWSCFVPSVQKAHQWIAEGRIGIVHLATYTGGINALPEHRIYNKALGGGALYDLGVYPIEIVGYILGKRPFLLRNHVQIGTTGVDETVSLIVDYEGCDGMLACTCHARIPSPSGFYGSKGFIQLEKTHMADHACLYDGQFNLIERFDAPFENGFQFEITHIRDCISKGLIESPIMPWQATLDSIRIYEGALHHDT